MGAVLKSPGFGENLYYPEHLMGYSYSLLIYNKNDQNIKGFDIKSLEGKTIGVFAKATDKIKRLNNVLEFNDIKSDIKYYGTSEFLTNIFCIKFIFGNAFSFNFYIVFLYLQC